MDEGVETALAVTDDLFLIDGMEVRPSIGPSIFTFFCSNCRNTYWHQTFNQEDLRSPQSISYSEDEREVYKRIQIGNVVISLNPGLWSWRRNPHPLQKERSRRQERGDRRLPPSWHSTYCKVGGGRDWKVVNISPASHQGHEHWRWRGRSGQVSSYWRSFIIIMFWIFGQKIVQSSTLHLCKPWSCISNHSTLKTISYSRPDPEGRTQTRDIAASMAALARSVHMR